MRRLSKQAAVMAAITALLATSIPATAHNASTETGSAAVAQEEAPNGKSLGLNRWVMPEKANWDWVTVALATAQYYGHAEYLSQNDICNIGLGRSGGECPNEQGGLPAVQRVARHLGMDPGESVKVLSMTQVKEQINNDSPIPIAMYWTQGGGVIMNIVGYEDNNLIVNTNTRQMGGISTIPYSNFVRNSKWKWGESLVGLAAEEQEEQRPPRPDRPRWPWPPVWPPRTGPQPNVPSPGEGGAAMSGATSDADRIASFFAATQQLDAGAKVVANASATAEEMGVSIAEDSTTVYMLNPDFVTGGSDNPATVWGEAKLATAGDQQAVMIYVDGGTSFAEAHTGNDELHYAAMANGGTVFVEPQIGAYYRIADGRVTPLNDPATNAIGETGTTIAEYQNYVQEQYAS